MLDDNSFSGGRQQTISFLEPCGTVKQIHICADHPGNGSASPPFPLLFSPLLQRNRRGETPPLFVNTGRIFGSRLTACQKRPLTFSASLTTFAPPIVPVPLNSTAEVFASNATMKLSKRWRQSRDGRLRLRALYYAPTYGDSDFYKCFVVGIVRSQMGVSGIVLQQTRVRCTIFVPDRIRDLYVPLFLNARRKMNPRLIFISQCCLQWNEILSERNPEWRTRTSFYWSARFV